MRNGDQSGRAADCFSARFLSSNARSSAGLNRPICSCNRAVAVTLAPAFSNSSAIPATVPCSNSTRTGTRTPRACATRDRSRTAVKELPPASKKLSSRRCAGRSTPRPRSPPACVPPRFAEARTPPVVRRHRASRGATRRGRSCRSESRETNRRGRMPQAACNPAGSAPDDVAALCRSAQSAEWRARRTRPAARRPWPLRGRARGTGVRPRAPIGRTRLRTTRSGNLRSSPDDRDAPKIRWRHPPGNAPGRRSCRAEQLGASLNGSGMNFSAVRSGRRR